MESPAGVVTTYAYNALQQRVGRDVDGDVTQFFWDGVNLRQESQAGIVEADYTLAPQPEPQPYGDLVSQHRASDSTFYHFDALGSTRALTDAGETVTDEATYRAFGETAAASGTTVNPFGWVGKPGYYRDEETGLLDLRQRKHDPVTGAFTTEDPLGFEAESNFYRYVGNNPVTKIDPSGLEEQGRAAETTEADVEVIVETDFDPNHIPYDRVVALMRAGMTSFYREGNHGVVVVYTSAGAFVLAYREERNSLLGIVETTLKDKYFQLITIVPEGRSPLKAVDLAFSKMQQEREEDWAGFLEFSLDWYQSLVPIYGASKQFAKGDIRGGSVSLLGDIAMIASAGLGQIGKLGRLAKIAGPGSRLATGIHATNIVADSLAGIHAIEQAYQIYYDPNGGALKATGRGGEALLRLLGLRVSLKQVKLTSSGVGTFPGPVRLEPRQPAPDIPSTGSAASASPGGIRGLEEAAGETAQAVSPSTRTMVEGNAPSASGVDDAGKVADDLIAAPSRITHEQVQTHLDEYFRKPGGALDKLSEIDPNAKLGMTGSTATGKVGNPRKETFGEPWNPDSFDLDLFIESNQIFDYLKRNGSVVRIVDGKEVIKGIDKLIPAERLRDSLVKDNPILFKGLREGGAGVSVKVYRKAPAGSKFGPPVIFGNE